MTPQQLKNSILQLAVQGKLVEQRPEEGTGEELYKQIQAEKQKLITEGKIKKEMPPNEIREDEIPFDIPDSWKWVRLESICNVVSARRVHQSDWKKEGVPFYRAREIGTLSEYGFVDNELFISEELYQEFSKGGVPQAGDLMITAVGTLGKVYIVQNNDRFYYKDASVICFENFGGLSPKYLKAVMMAPYMLSLIKEGSSGTTVGTITITTANQYLIPLPPLGEQQRIVAKIEELMPLVEQYEEAYNKLENLNKKFPEDMQKAILQYAVQGKLVEQRPEEGTGEELYKQIQVEKQKLIKEGKIKKEKPLEEIKEDEIPFDIPNSWSWRRLGTIATVLGGKRIPAGKKLTEQNTGHIYIRVSDMTNGSVSTDHLLFVPDDIFPSISKYIINKTDVFITVAGTIGRIGKIPEELDGANLTENADRLVISQINQDWLIQTLQSPFVQNQITDVTTKVGQPKLAIVRIEKLLIPIPPLSEQKRIVAKIEEFMPLVEKLKEEAFNLR